MCTTAAGGIIAIGEEEEILVFISTNFFSHQGLIDPLLVLPPYLSHEYVSACFPPSCPSRLLRPWWGERVTILEKWTQLRRPTAHNPPYQSAGIPHEHTSCFGNIFSRKVEIMRAKEKELAIANLQMLDHVLRLRKLNWGEADMSCQN